MKKNAPYIIGGILVLGGLVALWYFKRPAPAAVVIPRTRANANSGAAQRSNMEQGSAGMQANAGT